MKKQLCPANTLCSRLSLFWADLLCLHTDLALHVSDARWSLLLEMAGWCCMSETSITVMTCACYYTAPIFTTLTSGTMLSSVLCFITLFYKFFNAICSSYNILNIPWSSQQDSNTSVPSRCHNSDNLAELVFGTTCSMTTQMQLQLFFYWMNEFILYNCFAEPPRNFWMTHFIVCLFSIWENNPRSIT